MLSVIDSDVVSLPGLRPLEGVAGTGAPPDIQQKNSHSRVAVFCNYINNLIYPK
jgi:hypothetical protein